MDSWGKPTTLAGARAQSTLIVAGVETTAPLVYTNREAPDFFRTENGKGAVGRIGNAPLGIVSSSLISLVRL